MSTFEKNYNYLCKISDQLLHNPELGFKEFKTAKIIEDEIYKIDPTIEIKHYLKTGLKISFKHGKDKTIGIIAEMDALYQPAHSLANPETGAAHCCGHFTQVTTALAMINELVRNNCLADFETNLAFIFTPAEEFVDLDWRQKQKQKGNLMYFGGKQDAIAMGVFDDVDVCVSVHAIGEEFTKNTIEINCDLAGFNFKYFDFYGKASHAAFAPDAGINAQSIATLFTEALALSRQQVKDASKIRFNPVVIGKNTESINVVPDHVKMGTDLRYFDLTEANRLMKQFENAANGCALALGGKAEIDTQVGYLPFKSNRSMNAIVKEEFLNDNRIPDLIENRGYTTAGGDVGDVSYLMPTIQIGYGGWKGRIHGADFMLDQPEFVLKIFPEFVFNATRRIANNFKYIKIYRHSKEEYLNKLKSMENE